MSVRSKDSGRNSHIQETCTLEALEFRVPRPHEENGRIASFDSVAPDLATANLTTRVDKIKSNFLSDGPRTNVTVDQIFSTSSIAHQPESRLLGSIPRKVAGDYLEQVGNNAKALGENVGRSGLGGAVTNMAKGIASDYGLVDMYDGAAALKRAQYSGDIVGVFKGIGQVGLGILKLGGEVFGINDLIRGVACICRGEFLAGFGYLAFGVVGVMSLGTTCLARSALKVGFKAAAKVGCEKLAVCFEKALVSAYVKSAGKAVAKEALKESMEIAAKEGGQAAGAKIGQTIERITSEYLTKGMPVNKLMTGGVESAAREAAQAAVSIEAKNLIARSGRFGLLKIDFASGASLLLDGSTRDLLRAGCRTTYDPKVLAASAEIMKDLVEGYRGLSKKQGARQIVTKFDEVLETTAKAHVDTMRKTGKEFGTLGADEFTDALIRCSRNNLQTSGKWALRAESKGGMLLGIFRVNDEVAETIKYAANLVPGSEVAKLKDFVACQQGWAAAMRNASKLGKVADRADEIGVDELASVVGSVVNKGARKEVNKLFKDIGFKNVIRGETADVLSHVRASGVKELEQELGVSKWTAVGMKLMVSPMFFVSDRIAKPLAVLSSLAMPRFVLNFFEGGLRIGIFDHFIRKEMESAFKERLCSELTKAGYRKAYLTGTESVLEEVAARRSLGEAETTALKEAAEEGFEKGSAKASGRTVRKGTKEGIDEFRNRGRHYRDMDFGSGEYSDQSKKVNDFGFVLGVESRSYLDPQVKNAGANQGVFRRVARLGRRLWTRDADDNVTSRDESV